MCVRLFLITLFSLGLFSSLVHAEESALNWVGCGISKKAYMIELARVYEQQKGIKINVQGGGATKGIREVSNGTAESYSGIYLESVTCIWPHLLPYSCKRHQYLDP